MSKFPNFAKEHNTNEVKSVNDLSIKSTINERAFNLEAVKAFESDINSADRALVERNRVAMDNAGKTLTTKLFEETDSSLKAAEIDGFNNDMANLSREPIEKSVERQNAFQTSFPAAFEKISKIFYDKFRAIRETILPELSNETKAAMADGEIKLAAISSDPLKTGQASVEYQRAVEKINTSLETRDSDLLKKIESIDPKSKEYIKKTIAFMMMSAAAAGLLYFILKLGHDELSGCYQFKVDSQSQITQTKMDCPNVNSDPGNCGCQDSTFTPATKDAWCSNHRQYPMCCGGGANPICVGIAGSANSLYYGAVDKSLTQDAADAVKGLADTISAIGKNVLKYVLYIFAGIVALLFLYLILSKLLAPKKV